MPPFYDIYGFSRKRDSELIEKFLDKFAFRKSIETWEGCELEIFENEKYSVKEKKVSVNTLTEVIAYGINNPNHGFSFYLGSDGLKEDIKSLILKFTYDSSIIYGLSIEENKEYGNGNYKRALELETILKDFLPLEKTSIQVEYAPADDWNEFNEGIEFWKEMNEEERKTLYNTN